MVVYVTTQGSKIVREGRHLLVKKADTTYHTIFPYKLEQLVLFGNIQLTPYALKLLLRENIDTVFLRFDGRYQGRLASVEQKNVFLRKRQFLLTDDEAFCLKTAKSIVYGKIANMATVAQRIARTRNSEKAARLASSIRDTARIVDSTKSLPTLRGVEGNATALYFQTLRIGLDHDHGFKRRIRRPPTDPVNSVLSLIYTFLINRVYAAVRVAGLDPYPGVLHSLDYGRHSLPLDLIEEFRPIIADTLTLSLFNLEILKANDFYRPNITIEQTCKAIDPDPIASAINDPLGRMSLVEDEDELFDMPVQHMDEQLAEHETNDGGKQSVKIWPEAFKRILQAFERKMTTEFYHPVAEQKMTYAEALVFQARLYRQVVEGEAATYRPLLMK
ncbi:MAG: CRISPR-associated endonuclease Cas1 [Trichlorobacter sp.]|jgi:CRISPR-associated protein Cas1|nr:CRISPR-associated endonuclease Cas1 [Trichlorobacter sp.]